MKACISVLLCVSIAGLMAAQDNVPAPSLQAEVQRSHPTPRQECRVLVLDSEGRVVTVGVQSNGSGELNSTRQFLALGRYEGEHWVEHGKLSTRDGYVYFPAAAPDTSGGVWVAWCEFNPFERDWDVLARRFDGSGMGEAMRVSSNQGPDLRPAIVLEPDGTPLVAFECATKGSVQIMVARYRGGRWQEEVVTGSREPNFRPSLALDNTGATWLAWDRFVGGDYDVCLKSFQSGKWSEEIPFLASDADEQRPSIRVGGDNTVWIQSGKRVAGLRDNRRYELPAAARSYIDRMQSLDDFQIDPSGRFWFFEETQRARPDRGGESVATWFDGNVLQPVGTGMQLGYRAPVFDRDGALWQATDMAVFQLAGRGIPRPVRARIAGELFNGPVAETKKAKPAPQHTPHETIDIAGETYTLYWGEQHTHLGEHPADRIIESWVDRFYLKAAHTGALDFAATSDHDWVWMTNSKFMVQQAHSSVLSKPGEFEAFSGYEWSGNGYSRRRYGDRTVVFTRDYSPVFRITDPESDTPPELHRGLALVEAIGWAHHVGAPWAVMDWKTHDPVIEPVTEITSNHGVYETYNRRRAVPAWLRRPPVGKTSIQDGLAMGKRFGLVGSSDSHSGISGYETGMLGVLAKSLSREDIVAALRARRSYAVRGGEPILLDFRVNGTIQGGEVRSGGEPPKLTVRVKAQSCVEKIEVVRNGEYVYTHSPAGGLKEAQLDYQDTARLPPGTYYYVRVWVEGDKYAWSSPVWLE